MPRILTLRRLLATMMVASLGLLLPVAMPGVAHAAGRCAQPAHVWIHTSAGNLENGVTRTIPVGDVIYPTGVAYPRTTAVFSFYDRHTDELLFQHETFPSRDNCVIHHEDEGLVPHQVATYLVYGSFVDENGQGRSTFLGKLKVR